MVRIRFRRVGAKRQASYRIVAADRESPRDGRFLEVLGFYNPRTDPATVQVDEGRLFHWMQNGARPSDAVHTTLLAGGTWERWERYKQGEALEVLVQEAEQARAGVDPRTRRDDLAGSRRRKRRRMTAEQAPKPQATAAASAAPSTPPATQAAPPQAAAEPELAEPSVEPAEAAESAGAPAAAAESPAEPAEASQPAAEEAEPMAAAEQPEQVEASADEGAPEAEQEAES